METKTSNRQIYMITENGQKYYMTKINPKSIKFSKIPVNRSNYEAKFWF